MATSPLEGHNSTGSILLGNGNGSFQTPTSYVTGRLAYSVAVGDWNSDGHLDLAVTGVDQEGNGTVAILLGNSDGTFAAAQRYAIVSEAYSLALRDVNGDGLPDLAVGTVLGGTVTILVNDALWPGRGELLI
ncbi:MAG TPA: VCBS repeat-containing protein [Gemmataceae bacterium]|nr:VCBS repeat-containing protein [Gemmataceae bacterium]